VRAHGCRTAFLSILRDYLYSGAVSTLNYDDVIPKTFDYQELHRPRGARIRRSTIQNRESHASYEEKRLHREDRKRRIGAGHPFKIPLKNRLLMLLMYHRLYTTSTLLGFLRSHNKGKRKITKYPYEDKRRLKHI
jgi:hypothetical protein